LFLISSLFWAWILFWGGADWLEGSWLAAVFVYFRAVEWTAEGIKLFAGLMWLVESIWFAIGLFVRDARLFTP
jgi:hypothetical protein